MRQSQRLLIATIFALLAGAVTFAFQKNRDVIFESSFHEPYGTFDPREDKALLAAALAYAEGEMHGATCLAQWVGKDERYAYLTLGCGRFRKENDRIKVMGDQNFRPLRMRISGFELSSAERADPAALENSVRRLFPKAAADLIGVRMNPTIYREQGLAKQNAQPPAGASPAPAPAIPAK